MTDGKTIIYFIGVYDTLDLFTEKLKQAFEGMGYASFVYDARIPQSKDALLELLDEDVAFDAAGNEHRTTLEQASADAAPLLAQAAAAGGFACVTFNNLGYNLDLQERQNDGETLDDATDSWNGTPRARRESGRNLWEYYGIPYINILMDHPFHYEKPLRAAPSTSVVLCTDRNHVKYIRRYFKNIRWMDFLPHAGVELGSRHKPLAGRGIDVLYAGALPIYTVAKMIPDLSSIAEVDGERMAQEVLAELVRHPKKTTEQVIEEYLKSQRNDISEERIHEIIVQMRFIDSYATSFFREQAVRLLVENGVRVTAYGAGWDQCDWSGNPYLDYRGKVLAPEILPLMNDSKIVLNTMTWFKAGAHDRVFNGMLAGAAVVTDDSTYLRREFSDGKELVMFDLEDLGTLPERVFELFGHIDRAQQIADCGYRAAKEGHTWKSRAEYIAECFL